MKIGIMGGTFNPVHNGHLTLATAAKEAAGLHEVWFMPSGLPAHKSNAELLSSELRLAMVKLAVQETPAFLASSFEIDRPGFTYTADTMEALAQEYPEHEFFFIIGGDSLMKFHHWVKPEVISAHTTLLAAGRDEFSREELEQQAETLNRRFGTKVQLVSMPKMDISSRQIRTYLKTRQWEEVKQFLPEQVIKFILEQRLYMEVSYDFVLSLEQKLQQTLQPKRYLHTLGVAYVAASLAMCHGISHRDALIAGLLHDCAKNIPNEELLSLCKKHQLPLSEYEVRIPELLHAAYGAYLAREEYGIIQEDILLAIRNHTLGRPGMSPLEQIVYLADYFEPERMQPTTPSLDEIRKIAFQNLDEATYLVCKNTLQYLTSTGKEADPMTYSVFAYYEAKVKQAERKIRTEEI